MKFQRHFSILSAAIIINLWATSCHNHKEDKPTVMPPVKVKVMDIQEGESEYGRTYSGTVSSSETTTVSFSVAGTITDLYAKEGQQVSKGQLLGKLRAGEYQNAYNIAEAELAEAQDGYERLKKLHDANALPDVKWVEIQQKLKQAENAAAMARRTLEDANLHSPVAGTVTNKFVDVGQTVMPVEPVYEIISTNDLTIDIPVSEQEIGSFKLGDNAIVGIESIDVGNLEGKVTQKSVSADPLTRSYTVKVAIPNYEGRILPGMLGSVKFEKMTKTEENDSVANELVTLPSQVVLLNHDNRWFVWVVKDSVAERRFVEIDELTANGVTVTSGLTSGDKVIVEGMQKVGTGTRVIY